MKTSESIKELATALSKAQGEILGAPRESKNPFFNSTYADLDSCREAMREAFARNGLALTQDPTMIGSEPALGAMLMHSSGQWIEYSPIIIPVKEKNNPQALKSGITYMRRAQLLAICAMAEADDDGNEATQAQPKPIPNHAPAAKPGVLTMPFGKSKGTPIEKLSEQDIRGAIAWAKEKGKFTEFVGAAEEWLKNNEPPMPDPDELPF